MNDIALHVENVSKRYDIGARERDRTLREVLTDVACGPIRRMGRPLLGTRGHPPNEHATIWALRDVSFDVRQGEVVGIIGRNGAGKSTLLRIVSRITEPTTGYIELRGRVGTLLEVGTGFHPDLTGRENVYLNGAILGMRKAEIDRKFDEIVAFAEVEAFIDTPVKRYSSGMHMRLAFSVAAHLETDVLIVDEVLAVGDAQFQKRCLGMMRDLSSNQGRTVLFVSHNMEAIERLCSSCLVFERGRIIASGPTAHVVTSYLSRYSEKSRPNEWIDLSRVERLGTGEARFRAIRYGSMNAAAEHRLCTNEPFEVSVEIVSNESRVMRSIAVTLYSQAGVKLVNADTRSLGLEIPLQAGLNRVTLRMERLNLNPDVYRLGLWLADPLIYETTGQPYDFIETAFEVDVVDPRTDEPDPAGHATVPCAFTVSTVAGVSGADVRP